MSDIQQYDAFISYRHLPLDKAVAERVQTLLENYKAPFNTKNGQKNKIGRIFRDQSELPTSGNLDDALKRALETSQFLIVVLSRQTQESKWCMEEIRNFKEAHGGRISNILPILVDGEPDESIPDILRYETRELVNEDGSVELREVEVEPLCCDVRSDSIKGSMKKLKTEFLRLCAPMLGVGFDDLYQRHARRRKKISVMTAAAAGVILAVILSIIFGFAYQTYHAKQEQIRNLVDTYARRGASQITDGDYEQALMYYSEVLNLDDKTQTAKTGALLLLQQYGWLNQVGDGSGWISGEVLYESKYQAVAVDSTGEKQLRGTNQEGFSTFGSFLSAAQDGSCWTFATDDTITFYFTADSSVAQVERPELINPRCDTEDLEYYNSLNGNWGLSAMAPNRTRAVVCYGGYLYIYDLNEKDIRGTLYKTFDLSLVFENIAKNGRMTTSFSTWVDAGSNLCIVSDMNSAAVFNVTNVKYPCLSSFHEVYGRSLKDVAFSSDGQHYALVYGNDNGIHNNYGGSIEVYDQYGQACLITDFDGSTPLSGATFEPEGNRIAAWGGGELQIWDWSTGTVAAAPLKITDISSAVWLDDGRLAVSNGNGVIRYYTIVEYEIDDVSIELEEFEKQDYRQNDVELSTGYHIKYDTIDVIDDVIDFTIGVTIVVTDSQGTITDERKIIDTKSIDGFPNRMFVDDKQSTAYLWDSFGNFIVAVAVDKDGKIISVIELDTQEKSPLALYSVWNGVLAEMGTGELFYYDNGSPDAVCILNPSTSGSIQSIASNGSGLVSFVIRNQQYTDGYSFDYTYSVELWDLNKCIMLAELEKNSRKEITDLTFSSDKYLAFECGYEIVTWLLDAPTPNRNAINTLQNMSCYRLDESQSVQTVDVAFDAQALGNWNSLLHVSSEEIQEPDETFTQKMDNILQQQGEDVWLNEYNKWWNSEAPETAEIWELNDIIQNFFKTSVRLGRENEMHGALEKYIDIVCRKMNSDIAMMGDVDFIIYDILFYTPENADLAVKYYEQVAAMYEGLYNEDETDLNMACAYASHVCAGIIQGRGIDAFEISDDVMDGLYGKNMDVLIQNAFQAYVDLFSGNPEKAAAQIDSELSYMLLRELSGYVRVGALSEADYSAFVGSLKFPTGIRIAQVTSEQLEAGLRIGDVVTAVNGIHFGVPQYLNILRETNSITSVTVNRGESVFTIEAAIDWELAGGYPI